MTFHKSTDTHGVSFVSHRPEAAFIYGDEPEVKVLCEAEEGQSLYHEACVYHPPSRSIFVTSNQLKGDKVSPYEHTSDKEIKLFRIYDNDQPQSESSSPSLVEEVSFEGVRGAMLNGGVNYGTDSLLLCAQGSRNDQDVSGIISIKIPTQGQNSALRPENIVSNFHGYPFNSVNDVIVHPLDGSIWFTDPSYGYHQGIRPQPVLPNQLYRYDPNQQSIRAMADGFTRPNGLCFSPDLRTLYVTDTGAIHGSPDRGVDLAGQSHVYAFDVVGYGSIAPRLNEPVERFGPFLTNRRLFAFAPGRCPDGIKCDMNGNVYSGCLDGVEIWDQHGTPVGTIKVDGGVANFCFGSNGIMYACNETRVIRITLNLGFVKGALLGL